MGKGPWPVAKRMDSLDHEAGVRVTLGKTPQGLTFSRWVRVSQSRGSQGSLLPSSLSSPLLFAAFFHPSTASEGALHEKLLPLCLLLASHGQPKPPRVGRAWRPFGRVVHCWSPVYQFGWYPNHLVSLLGIKRKGHSLGLGAKGGQRSWR
ncbi:hypothetical protein AVEN_30807-1 [Araneus ventricosus]|uniref:Uncharacterized protein n=1 Tax=Araneus ventricosus TaxID=182803 RepID=A0A4Y2KTR2_ARAVE|nr:hypothetical protein AVEN_30807-1 [Araneus ventricosus]